MIGHKRIPSREGGIEIVVAELSSRLVKAGHTVHAYNRKGRHIAGDEFVAQNSKEYEGIRLITIPTFQNSTLNAFVYSFFATLRALFGKYDVLHYHAEGSCAMLWLARLFGKRIVATIHGLDWQRGKWGGFASKYLKFGERMAVRYAHQIIVLSKDHQRYFADTYSRETVYIPNGISVPDIENDDSELNQFGVKKNEYILFLARIVPEKGLHYLIEAYKNLNTTKKLLIAGSSSHTDEYVERIIQQIGSNKQIIMTGFVQGETLQQLFSHAYIYVLPSDVEGMPLSLLEAMSSGCCCLVSDIEQNTEVTADKAATFRKGNVDDLREKLKMLIDNPTIVEQYKKCASSYVCERFNWDDITKQTTDLYKKVTQKGRAIEA